MFDDVITLFCRTGAPKTQTFLTYEIRGVHFESMLSKDGDSAAAVIPFSVCAEYASPTVWETLTSEEKAKSWTLRKGDIIAHGEMTEEMESAAGLLSKGRAFVITGIAENDTKSPAAHFQVQAGHS